MEHQYHAQREAATYYQHIPHVPESFAVEPKLLGGVNNAQFVEAFRQYAETMKRMYQDMQARPEAYGVLVVDIHLVNENKEDGNLAKASWRSIKRLGDVMAVIGQLGEVDQDALRIPIARFKSALNKMVKVHLMLKRLADFGFVISDLDGEKFSKGADFFTVTYPETPVLMRVVKAYAIADAFHEDDPHEFYYFDYKRVADRVELPTDCVARDLAALIEEDKGQLLVALNSYFVDRLKLTSHYKDDGIEYYLKKKRVARSIIDFHTLDVQVILKLKEMDRYINLVSSLPHGLRRYFERGGCRYCGFQSATVEHCKFRVSWTLDGDSHDACGFECFNFRNPGRECADSLMQLMLAEYGIPKR